MRCILPAVLAFLLIGSLSSQSPVGHRSRACWCSTQKGTVGFRPTLPERKLAAMRSIWSGGTIRVIAEFRRSWWEDTVGHVPYFWSAPPSPFRTFIALSWGRSGPPALGASIVYPGGGGAQGTRGIIP